MLLICFCDLEIGTCCFACDGCLATYWYIDGHLWYVSQVCSLPNTMF